MGLGQYFAGSGAAQALAVDYRAWTPAARSPHGGYPQGPAKTVHAYIMKRGYSRGAGGSSPAWLPALCPVQAKINLLNGF